MTRERSILDNVTSYFFDYLEDLCIGWNCHCWA